MSDSYKIYASQEYVDGKVGQITGLPENAGSNQQLVTNKNGSVKWENLTHYKRDKITLSLSPKFDALSNSASGRYVGGTSSNNPAQVEAAAEIRDEMYKYLKGGPSKWILYFDGERVEVTVRRFPLYWTAGSTIDGTYIIPFTIHISTLQLEVYYNDDNEHTFGIELSEPELKQLDEDYIPDTIARKTDLPEIPTTDQANVQLVTNMNGEVTWEDKLCYYNVEEVEIFKEASTDGAGGAQLAIENSCSTEEGVACIVTFDGVEYVCYPYEIPDFATAWGNVSLYGEELDTGEPFCCTGLTTEMMSIIKFRDAVPHTFSARSQKRIYQTIDPAYIPFNAKSGEGENSVIIAAEMGLASGHNAVSLNGATATGTKATAVNVAFADGDCSFSQGYMSHANGYCSASFGGGTIASGKYQVAIGRGNLTDNDSKYAFIVGNAPVDDDGYVDGDQSSNAHTIDWNGNGWYQGTVESQGIILTDDATGAKYRIHVTNGALTMTPLEVGE